MSDLILNNGKNKRNPCSHCSKHFLKPSHLRRHQSTHTTIKSFECSDCKKWFKLKSSLERHQLQTHKRAEKHKCTQCKASFAQHSNLKTHLQRLHPNTKSKKRNFSCPQCSCIFSCPSALNRHKKARHKSNSKFNEDDIDDPNVLAQYVVEQLKSLNQNISSTKISNDNLEKNSTTLIDQVKIQQAQIIDKLHPEKYEKHITVQTIKRPLKRLTYVCEYCAKEFYKTYNLIRHLRIHTKFRPYPCNFCIYCFATKTQLENHMSNSHILDERTGILNHQHHCYICDQNFSSMRKLDSHIKTHANNHSVQYKCSICSLCFKTKSSFSTHNHKKIDKELEMLKDLLPEPSETEKQFQSCNDCGLNFLKKSDLQRHIRHHIINQRYKCIICGSSYTSKLSLRVHQKLHKSLKPFECNLCTNKIFNTKWQLERHIGYVHENSRNFKCVYCPKTFKTKSNCKSHMITHLKKLLDYNKEDISNNTIESQEAEITIRECNTVKFVTMENLPKRHKLNSKLDLVVTDSAISKPNTCKFCLKSFQKPHDLTRHLRIHTKEKPFTCELCEKNFSLKSTLEYHLKTHLKTTERKKIICQVCGKTYASPKSLAIHLRRHTATVPYPFEMFDKF